MTYRVPLVLSAIGAVLLVLAIVMPLIFPYIFEAQIDKKLLIRPESEMLNKFVDSPVPIYFRIYFFNITNVDEVTEGAKPILNEIGPYTYFQDREKVDVDWNDDLGTILFKQKKYFYFDPDLSNGSESDIVTTINPIFTGLAFKISGDSIPGVIKSMAQLLFLRFDMSPFMTHTIGETLFKGYNEPVLLQLYKLTNKPAYKLGKFGFLLTKNATASPEIEVYTGEKSMSNYQSVVKWKGYRNKVDYWKEDRCNRMNGTDGAQFARPIAEDKKLYLFSFDLCRSIHAVFEKNVNLGPVQLKRFVLPDSLLQITEDTKCFCSSNFTCRDGMIDITKCRDAPVIMSPPHFYQGQDVDVKAVSGLHPVKEKHETYLDIEPNTGVLMRGAKRLQISMPLRRYANLPAVSKVPELILPIFWVSELVEVPMKNVKKLHRTLTVPSKIVAYGSLALLCIGIVLIITAIILTVRTFKRSKNSKRHGVSDRLNNGNSIALLDNKHRL